MTATERRARENLLISHEEWYRFWLWCRGWRLKPVVKAALLVVILSYGFDFYAYGTWNKVRGFQTQTQCTNFMRDMAAKLASPRMPPDETEPAVRESEVLPTRPDRCAGYATKPGSITP